MKESSNEDVFKSLTRETKGDSMNSYHKLIVKEIASQVDRMYQVGGSLLPHPTRDYDFLLYSKETDQEISNFWHKNFRKMGMSNVKIHAQYSENDQGKKTIISLSTEEGICFDLLYVDDSYLDTPVDKYMEYFFPLSCQCIALDCNSGKMIGEVNIDTIKYWVDLDNPALIKYAKYYPEANFVRVVKPDELTHKEMKWKHHMIES